MNDQNPRKSRYSATVLLGTLLALAGAIWLGVLVYNQLNPSTELVQSQRGVPLLPIEEPPIDSGLNDAGPTVAPQSGQADADTSEPQSNDPEQPGVATPEPALALTPRLLIDSDLGTGSSEFSAVALNEDTNRLLIADDAGRLFEFDLDDAGLPITPMRRTLSVQVGAGDIEGLSWMFGDTYAIAHEKDGQITVVEIDDDITTITAEHLIRTIDTLIREGNGNGLEGVSYLPGDGEVEFVVVDERPPTMYLIDRQGQVVGVTALDIDVSDFSDVYASPTGVYSILSDEGRVVIDLTLGEQSLDAALEASAIGTIDLVVRAGQFEQPEGLVRSRDGTRLYIVGEAPGPDRFSFGFWSSN